MEQTDKEKYEEFMANYIAEMDLVIEDYLNR